MGLLVSMLALTSLVFTSASSAATNPYEPEECHSVVGSAHVRTHQEGEEVTIITWGAMVYTAEEAAKQLPDSSIEIIDLRTVMPWDKEAVLASARKTSKVLVLHEDTRTGGMAGELAATITESVFEYLDGPVVRVTAPDTPVPYSPPLEEAFLPNVDKVLEKARWLYRY